MKTNSKKKKNLPNPSNYAKYTGIAFQMIAIILLGVYGGIQLDKLVRMEFPLFTVLLTVLSVILSIYYVIHDLIKIK
jgi:F0F1-type ATP synthase assembly protein I